VIALAALGGAAGAEVPIAGIAGDQQAALFGQACDRPGLAKNTYGTGCFLLLNTGGHAVPSKNRLLTTVAWDLGGALTYALEGSVFVGGAAVQWLRDGLKLIRTAADVLYAMEKDAGVTLTELRVDGGATANELLMQFQADLLGVPVIRPEVLETTALGAAYLAGLAVGYWKDAEEIRANWTVARRFEPAMSRDRAAALRAAWERAVARAKGWA
jgi:glycerol kinase